MSDPAKTVVSQLDAVYEKYKHLGRCLSDPEWCKCGDSAGIYAIAGELWRAIKEAREVQQEIIPSDDIIADLERSLEFYRTRMNNLQCWQSSMRDPERKIVCDILASGFTLTTKEEIDRANSETSEQRIASAIEALEQQITTEGEEIPGHGNAAIKYAILLLKGEKK